VKFKESRVTTTVAIIGDRSEEVLAHRAIPKALEMASRALGKPFDWHWVQTGDITDVSRDLARYHGVWLVPGSPYENMDGALGAIRWARTQDIPFFGTCGGFQHLLVEYARNVCGVADADHAETALGSESLVVTRLSCSLIEAVGKVRLASGSRLRAAFGADEVDASYRCNYGLNPEWRTLFEKAGLRFTAFDEEGAVRGAELPDHPFFAGVLFQPEREALQGRTPAVVVSWLRAAFDFSGKNEPILPQAA
jgi:CTP synthase (UTP-ammonia lyase)